ncbi:MAG: hypothetical protein JRG91_00455 [Deltaproteobacteria bacterium]|nr:hypothetical protein [Deltaproteobacteria bacterium]
MKQTRHGVRAGAAALAILLCAAPGADGTQTKIWEVATHDDFAGGTFEGTQVDSAGELTMGIETLRAEIPRAAAVWSSLEVGSRVYLGTGNEGALYALDGDRLLMLTRTHSVALTSLVTDGSGALYAGSLPGGAIFRFSDKKLSSLAGKAVTGGPKIKWEPGGESSKKKDKKKKDKKKKDDKKKIDKKKDTDKEKDTKGEKATDKAKKKKKIDKKKDDKKKDDKKKKGPKPWVELEDADHVWALVWDEKKKTIYAGTGPEGIVYAIDASGRATVLADTDEEHILSLVLADDGSLLAGTGNNARLLRIEGPGRVQTLWDFDATEVKSIALIGDKKGDEPVIVAAVNKFKTPPKVSAKMPSKKDLSSPSKGGKSSFSKPPQGTGLVAAILPGGGYRTLYKSKKTHLTALRAAKGGVHVATGSGGRVLEVDLEGKHAVILDTGERQILTFALAGKRPVLGTADPAAVHRVLQGPPSDPLYLSKVFDAGFQARWGTFVLRGEGAVSWQTRSGNTKEPDETWSEWSSPQAKPQGKVKSPGARFVQYRIRVKAKARVWNTQLFYLPRNQQATITEITVNGQGKSSKGKSGSSKSKSGGKNAAPDPEAKIKWKVDNADADPLRYELWFALEGTDQWIPILDESEILTKTEYKWDTTSVPAGHYLVRVLAVDDTVNDPTLAASHTKISHPVLVDNDPPTVTLKVKSGKGKATFTGTVADDFSEITRIEITLDGGPFLTLFPKDLIFDEKKEKFSYTAKDLEKGPHTVTVRAYDRKKNGTSVGDHFTVK